jgi:hypothetical protein
MMNAIQRRESESIGGMLLNEKCQVSREPFRMPSNHDQGSSFLYIQLCILYMCGSFTRRLLWPSQSTHNGKKRRMNE